MESEQTSAEEPSEHSGPGRAARKQRPAQIPFGRNISCVSDGDTLSGPANLPVTPSDGQLSPFHHIRTSSWKGSFTFSIRFWNLAPHTLWKHDCWFNSRAVSSSRWQTARFCVVSTRSASQRLLGSHFAPAETLVGNAEGQERTGQAQRMFFLAGSQPFPHVSGFCCSYIRSRSSSSQACQAGSPSGPSV